MKTRPLSEIAAEIRADWGPRINSAAAPYVAAMEKLKRIEDDYGHETAVEIVVRFLSVANTWRGKTARRVKAELNAMLKTQGDS
jgi:hypothetical protein